MTLRVQYRSCFHSTTNRCRQFQLTMEDANLRAITQESVNNCNSIYHSRYDTFFEIDAAVRM